MATYLLRTLSLEFDNGGTPMQIECQLSTAELLDEPSLEEVESFCGKVSSSTPNYNLHLSGWQDYKGQTAPVIVDGVCDILHAAYLELIAPAPAEDAGEIDFVLTVGNKTRTGTCKPTQDVPFGGTAGAALTFDVTLDVVGNPVDGVVAPVTAAA